MKKIDYLHSIASVNVLLIKIGLFRAKYKVTESAFWDLMHVYWYYLRTGEGLTNNKLAELRYGYSTGMQAIVDRKGFLIKKGLLTQFGRHKVIVSQLAISEIRAVLDISVEDLSKVKRPASVLKKTSKKPKNVLKNKLKPK